MFPSLEIDCDFYKLEVRPECLGALFHEVLLCASKASLRFPNDDGMLQVIDDVCIENSISYVSTHHSIYC